MDLETTEKRAFNALLLKVQGYEKEINSIYKQALLQVQGELTKIYNKYSNNGILTYAEMSKYNRLKSLEDNMVIEINRLTKETVKIIDRLRPEVYQESFYRYAWALDNGMGVRLNWGVISPETIKSNLANHFYDSAKIKLPFTTRIAVMDALNAGLPIGKSLEKMAKDMRGAFNGSQYNALRVARTEGLTAVSMGQDELFQKADKIGIKGKEVWIATLDDRTRITHQAMDGTEKGIDGFFPGPGDERARYPRDFNLSAGERVNCRCTVIYRVEEYPPIVRRSREQGVIPYQTFEDWEKTYAKK